MPVFSVPENLAFDSYSALVAGINDWLDRSDLTGVAQQMIALCEARLQRELSPLFQEVSTTIIATNGVGVLPTDTGMVRRVFYTGQFRNRALPQVSAAAALDIPISYTEPYAYSLEAGNINLWPAKTFTVGLLYLPLLARLSAANPNSTLLSQHPDVYFFGSLMFAHGYEANDRRAATFKALWDEAIQSAKVFFTKQKFGGPLVPRVAFVP